MLRRLGVNLLYLVPGKVGGTETYAVELVRSLALAHPGCEVVIFCGRDARSSLQAREFPANVRVAALPIVSRIKPLRVLAELTLLPMIARSRRVDVLHSMGTTAPLLGVRHGVVTIHDLIFHHFPATFPGPAQRALDLLVPAAARRSTRVIAISEATKRDLIETYSIDAGKIDVVHLGAGFREPAHPTPADELRERFELSQRPIVLTIAAALVHKNIDRVLEAVAALRDREIDVELVMIGHAGLERDNLLAKAEELGVGNRLTMTGWVSDEELAGFYAMADCFVFASLLEGFGIPVLEAMQRDLPVASSNAGSLPEVVGDAALMFDPLRVDEIAGAIERLLGDNALRESLVSRGRLQAAQFTWERAAKGTWDSYLAALAGNAPEKDGNHVS